MKLATYHTPPPFALMRPIKKYKFCINLLPYSLSFFSLYRYDDFILYLYKYNFFIPPTYSIFFFFKKMENVFRSKSVVGRKVESRKKKKKLLDYFNAIIGMGSAFIMNIQVCIRPNEMEIKMKIYLLIIFPYAFNSY